MRTKIALLAASSLIALATATACDEKPASESQEASSPADQSADKAGNASGESDSSSKDDEFIDPSDKDLPRGDAPDTSVVDEVFAEQASRAEELLFDSDQCSAYGDLKRCRGHEESENWTKAAMCYRSYVLVGGDPECKMAQYTRAVGNFRRAGADERATEAARRVVKAGDEFDANLVIVGDSALAHRNFDAARSHYARYLSESGDGPLAEYVKTQCKRLDGCKSSETSD